jgi:hypothetical protein
MPLQSIDGLEFSDKWITQLKMGKESKSKFYQRK